MPQRSISVSRKEDIIVLANGKRRHTPAGRQLLFVALTVALGISLATAMLNVMSDVGEKVNQELKAFGANITVTSKIPPF